MRPVSEVSRVDASLEPAAAGGAGEDASAFAFALDWASLDVRREDFVMACRLWQRLLLHQFTRTIVRGYRGSAAIQFAEISISDRNGMGDFQL